MSDRYQQVDVTLHVREDSRTAAEQHVTTRINHLVMNDDRIDNADIHSSTHTPETLPFITVARRDDALADAVQTVVHTAIESISSAAWDPAMRRALVAEHSITLDDARGKLTRAVEEVTRVLRELEAAVTAPHAPR